KAGGPQYVRRFLKGANVERPAEPGAKTIAGKKLDGLVSSLGKLSVAAPKARIEAMEPISGKLPEPLDAYPEELPGPTGELNRLSNHARGTVLCLGPDKETALAQAAMALSQGNKVVVIAP